MHEQTTTESWEYLTEFLYADAKQQEEFLREMWPQITFAKYAPQATMPRLNQLGALGWELMHIEPVLIGRNEDIRIGGGDMSSYSNVYFCVFKRRKN